MPNMSYCMFENTSRAINQLLGAMEEACDDLDRLKLNEYEQRAWNDLPEQMVEFLELFMNLDPDGAERVERLIGERLGLD